MVRKDQTFIYILPEFLDCFLLLPTVQVRLLSRVIKDILVDSASILSFMLFLGFLDFLLLPFLIIVLV